MFKVIACVLVLFSTIWANENPEYLRVVYEVNEFFIFNHEVDFLQAIARCKKLGWTLATEESDDDGLALNWGLELLNLTEHEYYLGGINQKYGDDPSVWLWLETAEEISYSNWGTGEPTDGKDCLLRGSVDSLGNWTSSDCTAAHRFICQPVGQ